MLPIGKWGPHSVGACVCGWPEVHVVALPRQLNRRGVAHYVPATFLCGKCSWHVSWSCHPLFAMWSGRDDTIRLYPDSDSLSYGSFSALAGGGVRTRWKRIGIGCNASGSGVGNNLVFAGDDARGEHSHEHPPPPVIQRNPIRWILLQQWLSRSSHLGSIDRC